MHRWKAIGLAAGVTLVTSFSAAAQDGDERRDEPRDPAIAYRTHVMKSMSEQAAALGQIMQKKVPYEQNIALHAEAISLGAREALKAFEPKVIGGTAKPEVWDNWKDFSDRLKALDAAASEVAKLARDDGAAAAQPKVLGMLTCKSCHDKYRTK